MQIFLVGPTHPYKGGVAQYTTELAHQLTGLGHDVAIESWSNQYPSVLYPGQLTVREPELPPFLSTRHRLAWWRPDSWYAAGRRLRNADVVVFVVVTPVQMPAYLGILAGCGRRRRPRVVAQCHNVLPHERRRVDVVLLRSVLSRVDSVLVHSQPQGAAARTVTDRPVTVEHMAPLVVARSRRRETDTSTVHRRLLFFGIVRPYKGLDLLLHALAEGPSGVRLRVAGEFWGGPAATRQLVGDLGLADRVDIRPGYVDGAEVPNLFTDVDALVLPYRSATASLNVFLAFEHGVPVIATRVGTVEQDVADGVNGVLCPPDDATALTRALDRFYADGEPQRLRAGVPPVDAAPAWRRYCAALLSVVSAASR